MELSVALRKSAPRPRGAPRRRVQALALLLGRPELRSTARGVAPKMPLLLFLTLLVLPMVVRSASCPAEAERWGMWQCTWTLPAALPSTRATTNPFDVELLIDLQTTPPSSNVTVRGFYDGDGLFRARFMPPAVGTWSWRTRCDTVSELNDHVGKLTVTAPQDSRNHGPVVAGKGHESTKFAYADGTPFHSVGTTVYGLAGSGWGSTPANTSATLATLRDGGSVFNKVVSIAQHCPLSPQLHLFLRIIAPRLRSE